MDGLSLEETILLSGPCHFSDRAGFCLLFKALPLSWKTWDTFDLVVSSMDGPRHGWPLLRLVAGSHLLIPRWNLARTLCTVRASWASYHEDSPSWDMTQP